MPREPSVAVVCWDVGHNALGRAHLLADMLADDHDVEIVGSHFPEYGSELWGPFRDTPIPVRTYPGGRFPGHFHTMERMAEELSTDVVYVVKPRWPGLGVGFLARGDAGRRLVVDCDDLELSFVGADHGMSLGEAMELQGHPDFLRPEGRIWTAFSEWAVRFADGVTAANVPLAARYGSAVVIPHARDERVFDPALYDRDESRADLGVGPDDRVVLFGGTPRRHKGLQQVASALSRIGDRRNRLCVLATPELEAMRPVLAPYADWVHPVAPRPFSRLPHLLAAADAVCVLQDPESETARWQMPAKITDALAMGVPCLVNPMPPLLPLVDEGVLTPVSDDDLASQLGRVLDDPGLSGTGKRGREVFLDRLSYASVRPRLRAVVERAASGVGPPAADLVSTVAFHRSIFGPATPAPAPDDRVRELASVRATIASVLPDGAGPVAVVSRGDGDLIRLTGRVGWHFPRTDDGAYAGHHPQDSDAAIEQLEEVRRRGARYLVIPSSSSWWLDHYVGFRDHLATNYTLSEPGNGIRALVELTHNPETTSRRGDP